jgi:hypothetical protein
VASLGYIERPCFKKTKQSGQAQWFMPVTLINWKAEIRRIEV